MSEVVVIRCPMAAHPQLGVPRVPLRLAARPNLDNERDRDSLILEFLKAHTDLVRQHGGPMLPTGVDPDWKLTEAPAEQADVNAGATVCLELTRDTELVTPDPGAEHRARALSGVPALQGEVPSAPGQAALGQAAPGQAAPPVLGPGEVPPPAAPAPPAPPQQGPAPDIRPAGCGGSACVIVNGVEAHESATCPQGLGG